jgi:hypothetical protein
VLNNRLGNQNLTNLIKNKPLRGSLKRSRIASRAASGGKIGARAETFELRLFWDNQRHP